MRCYNQLVNIVNYYITTIVLLIYYSTIFRIIILIKTHFLTLNYHRG